MEQYALYLVMKDVVNGLNKGFVCSFNDMDLNKPNVVGIYIRGGNTPRYRELSTGGYYNYTARVQFILQGDSSKESLMSVLSLASDLRHAMENSCNLVIDVKEQLKWVNGKITYDPTNKLGGSDISVLLTRVSLMGEVSFKGKTTQALPIYVINTYIEYYCKVKEEKQNGN